MNQVQSAGEKTSSRAEKMVITGSVLALALGSGLAATPAAADVIVTPLDITLGNGDSYTFGPGHTGHLTSSDPSLFEFTVTSGAIGPFSAVDLHGNDSALSTNTVAVLTSAKLREYASGQRFLCQCCDL